MAKGSKINDNDKQITVITENILRKRLTDII